MPRAILFDLDDTLLDRHGTLLRFLPGQYKRFSSLRAVPQQVYMDCFMRLDRHGATPRLQLYKHLVKELGLAMPGHRLHIDFLRYGWSLCRLCPGARELLAHLRADGWRIGCVTNGAVNYQMRKLSSSGLVEYFDSVVIAEEVGVRKPDPQIFQVALNRIGSTAAETLFVGDNPLADIQGARAAGMRTIWIPSHHPWPQETCAAPDHQVTALDSILSCCDQL
ncbi:MAG: HAD family hydrolase [Planctomycetota bacterium]